MSCNKQKTERCRVNFHKNVVKNGIEWKIKIDASNFHAVYVLSLYNNI